MKPATTSVGWSRHEMWPLASAINSLRKTIENSRAIVGVCTSDKLLRDCDRLEQQRQTLVRDAGRAAAGDSQLERNAIAKRILYYYRAAGELERAVASVRHERSECLAKDGAGDGDRTRDIELGKLAFYR